MVFYMIRSSGAGRSSILIILSKKFFNECLSEILIRRFAAETGKQRPAADQQLVDLIVIPAYRPHFEKYLLC